MDESIYLLTIEHLLISVSVLAVYRIGRTIRTILGVRPIGPHGLILIRISGFPSINLYIFSKASCNRLTKMTYSSDDNRSRAVPWSIARE
jgi:hypothetical protein